MDPAAVTTTIAQSMYVGMDRCVDGWKGSQCCILGKHLQPSPITLFEDAQTSRTHHRLLPPGHRDNSDPDRGTPK